MASQAGTEQVDERSLVLACDWANAQEKKRISILVADDDVCMAREKERNERLEDPGEVVSGTIEPVDASLGR